MKAMGCFQVNWRQSLILMTGIAFLGLSLSFASAGTQCESKQVAPEVGVIQELQKIAESGACRLAPRCENLGIDRNWALHAMDADLLPVTLREPVESPQTSIAVLDTGYDSQGIPEDQVRKPDLVRYVDEAGILVTHPPGVDYRSHGSRVISVLSGRNGAGIVPGYRVRSYAIYGPADDSVNDLPALLELRIEDLARHACSNGAPIINISQHVKVSFSLAEELAEKGCMLVYAAGNHGAHLQAQDHSISDSVLEVGATSPWGGRASFSEGAMLAAPGVKVWTVGSSQFDIAKFGYDETLACEYPGAPDRSEVIDGTSFAAPLVAGTAAMVREALRADDQFLALPGETQVTLISKMVHASTLDGNVNALRAVTMANAWVRARAEVPEKKRKVRRNPLSGKVHWKDTLTELDVDSFDDLLIRYPDPLCNSQLSCRTSQPGACEFDRVCIENIRRKIAICPGSALEPSESLTVAEAAFEAGNYEMGSRYLNRFATDPQKLRTLLDSTNPRYPEPMRRYILVGLLESGKIENGWRDPVLYSELRAILGGEEPASLILREKVYRLVKWNRPLDEEALSVAVRQMGMDDAGSWDLVGILNREWLPPLYKKSNPPPEFIRNELPRFLRSWINAEDEALSLGAARAMTALELWTSGELPWLEKNSIPDPPGKPTELNRAAFEGLFQDPGFNLKSATLVSILGSGHMRDESRAGRALQVALRRPEEPVLQSTCPVIREHWQEWSSYDRADLSKALVSNSKARSFLEKKCKIGISSRGNDLVLLP